MTVTDSPITPTDSFVEAMQKLTNILQDADEWNEAHRQAVEAWADMAHPMDTVIMHKVTGNGVCYSCRTALLKRVMGGN